MTLKFSYLIRFYVYVAFVNGVFSQCKNKELCRTETLTSTVKTKPSYFSMKRMVSTILNAVPLQKSTVRTEQHCLKKCMASSTCLSINLISNLTANITDVECQLLSQQAYENKDKLVYQENSTHLSGLNLGCERQLCVNNATCIPNYVDDTSTCKCVSTSFSGIFCEEELKVVSIKYTRGTDNNPQMVYVMRDQYFKKMVQSSTCLLQFSDSVRTGASGHTFALFVPPETGLYYFKVTCNTHCRLYVSTLGKQDKRLLYNEGGTIPGIYMEKNRKMFVEMFAGVPDGCQFGCGNPYSLGVQLPNGSSYSVLENSFLETLF